MAEAWCKVSANLDNHPKIRRAGFWGSTVFQFALRKNSDPANPVQGFLPEAILEPWYIANQLGVTESDASDGRDAAVTAGLLQRHGHGWMICGWDEEWGMGRTTSAERMAKHRERLRLKTNNPTTYTNSDVTCDSSDSSDVTPVTCDETRLEETRLEETRTKTPIVPTGDIPSSVSKPRPRKPKPTKPTEPTQSEAASVRMVLDKLTAQNGVRYTGSDEHTRLIVSRLRDGCSEMDLRYVIGYCALELGWKDKPDMLPYLRPETLFGPKTVERYLDPARTWAADADPKPAPLPKPTTFGPELDEPDWIAGGAHG